LDSVWAGKERGRDRGIRSGSISADREEERWGREADRKWRCSSRRGGMKA
jgi:hypothetical protein